MDQIIPTAEALSIPDIDVYTDTREILRRARADAERHGYADWLIVDVDAHHVETVSWPEIIRYVDDPVIRDQAQRYHQERVGAPPYGMIGDFGLRYQDCGGRIPHQSDRRETITEKGVHRDIVLTRRAMDGLCVDYMVVFPTPMLFLGMHPQTEMEIQLGRAYNRWVADTLLQGDNGIVALSYLPFNSPEAACRTVEEFAGNDKVIGFTVTSTRYKPVHSNEYMRLYRMIEETGKPLAFHAGYHWQDPSLSTMNTFLGMHSLGFVWCNLVHMTNWILNGLPVKFPGAEDRVGRERARLGSIPDAAAR